LSRNPYLSEKRSHEKQLKRRGVPTAKTGETVLPAAASLISTVTAPVSARVISKLLAYGLAHHQAGRLGEAERVYRRILELDAQHAEGLHLLGMVAFQTGQCDAAAELISRAILRNGTEDRYFTNLGNVLQGQGRLEEAVSCYRRALQLNPGSGAAQGNLGLALQFLNKLEEAAESFERALDLVPQVAVTYTNLGNVRQAQGRLEEAAACHKRALALEPRNPEAWCNLGSVLDLQGRMPESEAAYDHALELKPDFGVALFNRSLLYLRTGNFVHGWPGYEHRYSLHRRREFVQPQWHGEPLNGARILLYAEQGLGDALQFMRYIPLVKAAGGTVVLEVQPQLRRLALQLPGVAELTCTGQPPPFDWHCSLLSLPLAFGTALDTIPGQTPYLPVPPEAAKKAAGFPWPDKGLRVGIVWAGRPEHLRDRFRSIPLPLLTPLFGLEGVQFFSLQLGPAAADLPVSKGVTDLSEEIQDLADTAALVGHLDLVITVDTAVAHLAGALDKPVWVMLPFVADWRWLLNREDSPWYPSMRLFRQSTLGDWRPVVEKVRGALLEQVREGGG